MHSELERSKAMYVHLAQVQHDLLSALHDCVL
jgi:hypothetical protein